MPAKPKKSVLALAAAAAALGVTVDFVLALTLTGARRPTEQGDDVIEIEYQMDGDEVTFTAAGVDRFLKRCPIGELVTTAKVADRLGIHRPQLSVLRYTGVPSAAGPVVKLPVWQIAGGEYVMRAELEAFAEHHCLAVERKAAREFAKRYSGRKPKAAQEA